MKIAVILALILKITFKIIINQNINKYVIWNKCTKQNKYSEQNKYKVNNI